jgi:hypothetical protein
MGLRRFHRYVSNIGRWPTWPVVLYNIMGCGNRDACRNIFKKLKILLLMSQYILSLLTLIVNNRNQFLINSEIHNTSTHARHSSNLHLPSANLDIYQREVYYSSIKVFNSLTFNTTNISDNPRTFKIISFQQKEYHVTLRRPLIVWTMELE